MRTALLLALASCASGSQAPMAPSTAAPSATVAERADATASAAEPASASPGPPASPASGGSVLVGDILAPKGFDPKPTIDGLTPKFLACFQEVRGQHPDLHGKLRLRIQVNEAGTVIGVDAEEGGNANHPALVGCLGSVLRQERFPKPGGMATIVAPLVFRR
jgi:hypothetical protein